MDQSGKLFGVIVFAFIVFITVRGELRDYLKVIGL